MLVTAMVRRAVVALAAAATFLASCALPSAVGPPDGSQSSSGPVCSPTPPATDPTACNTLFNTALWTSSVYRPGATPPTPQGGPLADGIYECTALDTYGSGGSGERMQVRDTVVVTDGGTTLWWANDALDTNANMIETVRGNTTASFQGNLVTFTETCGVAVIPWNVGFTANPDGFLLFDQGDPLLWVYTFSRSRCSGGD
ncbi:MAG TPA: hypothetical protein VKZ18_14345 [Polyangia bacterium]|nr:hypothetical protein [Polyangia bacterium]